ncbi:MAG: heme A synthase [Flavobacteriaceae bacterium]|nr:heme A synthase [Flavobacteriaceae bacterium]
MKKYFPLLVKICLISVYVIILAGATVRMTGSGMGCPDWPKCFGHLIPPTNEDELNWKENTEFKKGLIIIKDEALFVAKKNFRTTSEFNLKNWNRYTKHDYAEFNVMHTWVEYINRLATVVSGVFFLILIIGSLKFWKENKKIVLLSFLALFLMVFEAWLGKTVVDSNLAISKITIHMLVALLIVALLLTLRYITVQQKPFKYDKLFSGLLLFVFALTILQIVLGINVREFVDEQLKRVGIGNKSFIELEENTKFMIHRSFSIVLVLLNVWLYIRNRKLKLGYKLPFWILAILAVEILAGVAMQYADFPFGSQVLHLLFAALLFGVQFYLILEVWGLKLTSSIATRRSPLNV